MPRLTIERGAEGYALLAVLWICVGVGALGIAIAAAARDSIARSRNRTALAQAEWVARGCLARVQARVAEALAPPAVPRPADRALPDAWNRLDSVVAPSPASVPSSPEAECTVAARATGATLDVNAAPEPLLAAVLRNAGVPPARADTLAASLADWRDADDEPREMGAERAWYAARGLAPPRNAPFVDRREIALARGMASAPADLFGVDGGGISIHDAPPAVLAALPGFGPEAVARAVALRRAGGLDQYRTIADGLTPSASTAFMDALPQLVSLVTLEPTGWVVRAEARAGTPPVRAAAELRLAWTSAGARVVRRRVEYP